jgi:hypothetical protein
MDPNRPLPKHSTDQRRGTMLFQERNEIVTSIRVASSLRTANGCLGAGESPRSSQYPEVRYGRFGVGESLLLFEQHARLDAAAAWPEESAGR